MRVYTDGSCLNNPGRGGWAYIIVDTNTTAAGREQYTTNNRMEMTAAISAIEAVNALGQNVPFELYTDSMYVINGITKWVAKWISAGWKKPNKAAVKNADLWQKLSRLNRPNITWKYVAGHSGDKYNDIADTLARSAALSKPA